MIYEENLEKYRVRLEESKAATIKEIENLQKNGEFDKISIWQKSLEYLEYCLENLEASYTMDVMWHITHATYYNVSNVEEYILNTTGVDLKANQIYKSSYGMHNLEDFRRKLIKLSGLKIEIPTLLETRNTYNEIINSNMSQEEKREILTKYECLTGIACGGFNYEKGVNNVGVRNLNELHMSIKDEDALSVFYEYGLDKSLTK